MAKKTPDIHDALNHPLRRKIMQKMAGEKLRSPNELSKELKEGLSQISYHVKVLVDSKTIKLVKTEPRRGAVEHFYKLVLKEPWARQALGLAD